MSSLTIHADFQLKNVQNLIRQIHGKNLNKKIVLSLNQATRDTEKKTESIVAKDMSALVKAIKTRIFIRHPANDKQLQATIKATKNPVPLKFFKNVKEQPHTGTTLTVFGSKTMYEGAFTKGGSFPNRKELKLGGNILYRTGKPATKGKRKGKKNSGITNAAGIPIAESMNKPEISNAIVFYGQEQVLDRLKYNLNNMIKDQLK